ncbi:hypothetical protein BON22_4681 [Cyberlindnera fabianii]|uniref:Uncharacterized protein n=1 Tax=Cyberlindnera fabianii TaxID=36022 RepID=A0A1V2L371_CYBFA|nr:hypothetical protein BON22_4681 [Cyberlindnera fabianii]
MITITKPLVNLYITCLSPQRYISSTSSIVFPLVSGTQVITKIIDAKRQPAKTNPKLNPIFDVIIGVNKEIKKLAIQLKEVAIPMETAFVLVLTPSTCKSNNINTCEDNHRNTTNTRCKSNRSNTSINLTTGKLLKQHYKDTNQQSLKVLWGTGKYISPIGIFKFSNKCSMGSDNSIKFTIDKGI